MLLFFSDRKVTCGRRKNQMDDKNNNNTCKQVMSVGKVILGIKVLMSNYNGEKYLREQMNRIAL